MGENVMSDDFIIRTGEYPINWYDFRDEEYPAGKHRFPGKESLNGAYLPCVLCGKAFCWDPDENDWCPGAAS
jgi:hypothetical protein